MSFNKVLNRPLFRQQALKKGYLKPIHAQTGVMGGSPTTPPPFPALRKPPTFMERMSVSGPARFLRQGVSIPTVGGYVAGEKVADAFGGYIVEARKRKGGGAGTGSNNEDEIPTSVQNVRRAIKDYEGTQFSSGSFFYNKIIYIR